MKKNILLLFTAMSIISPLIAGCATRKDGGFDEEIPTVPSNPDDGQEDKPNKPETPEKPGEDGNNDKPGEGGGSENPNTPDNPNEGGESENPEPEVKPHILDFDYNFLTDWSIDNVSAKKGCSDTLDLLESVTAKNCYKNDDGKLKLSSSSAQGSLTFKFKNPIEFNMITLNLSKYHNDNASLTIKVGNQSAKIDKIKTGIYPITFNNVTSDTIKIESKTKRCVINSIEINGNSGTDVPNIPVDPEIPEIPQPATVNLSKSGEGTVEVSPLEGLSGDVVTLKITHAKNVFVRIKNNGKRVSKDNGVYTFVLTPGENNLTVEFVTFVPGVGHPELFESEEAQHYGDRGDDLGSVDEYYEPTRGLKGEALKRVLYEICQPQYTFDYDHLKKSFPLTDFNPDNPNYMTLMYTGEQYSITDFNRVGWSYINREHVWPNSRGTGKKGAGSDKHMQRPCEQKINGRRGSLDFGYAYDGEILTDVNAGNKIGSVFEPKDEFKGDTARIIFYIATVYNGFELTRPHASGFNYWSGTHTHGVFDDLYEWATDPSIDPVSKFEMSRNNKVDELYQNNRNPFIDHPEFIKMIYDKSYEGPGALLD